MPSIDHIVLAVLDLEEAARALRRRGLASVPGGEHPQWGTANRVAPLRHGYVELLGVVDPEVARSSELGHWIGSNATPEGEPVAWVIEVEDIEAVGESRGLEVSAASRTRPDGGEARFRVAGIEQAMAERCFPFFITWDTPELRPSPAHVHHPRRITDFTAIQVTGPAERLQAWLEGLDLPVEVVEGRPGLRAVVGSDQGDIVFG